MNKVLFERYLVDLLPLNTRQNMPPPTHQASSRSHLRIADDRARLDIERDARNTSSCSSEPTKDKSRKDRATFFIAGRINFANSCAFFRRSRNAPSCDYSDKKAPCEQRECGQSALRVHPSASELFSPVVCVRRCLAQASEGSRRFGQGGQTSLRVSD